MVEALFEPTVFRVILAGIITILVLLFFGWLFSSIGSSPSPSTTKNPPSVKTRVGTRSGGPGTTPNDGDNYSDVFIEAKIKDNSGSGLDKIEKIRFDGDKKGPVNLTGQKETRRIFLKQIKGTGGSLSSGKTYNYSLEVHDNKGNDTTHSDSFNVNGGGPGGSGGPAPILNVSVGGNPQIGKNLSDIKLVISAQAKGGKSLSDLKIQLSDSTGHNYGPKTVSGISNPYNNSMTLEQINGSDATISSPIVYNYNVKVKDSNGKVQRAIGHININKGSSPSRPPGGGSPVDIHIDNSPTNDNTLNGGSGGGGSGSVDIDNDPTISPEMKPDNTLEGGNIEDSGNSEINDSGNATVEDIDTGDTTFNAGNTNVDVNLDGVGAAFREMAENQNKLIERIINGDIPGDADKTESGKTSLVATVEPFPIRDGMDANEVFLEISAESQEKIKQITTGIDGNNRTRNTNRHRIKEQIPLSTFLNNYTFQEGETHQYIANIRANGENANTINRFNVKPTSNKKEREESDPMATDIQQVDYEMQENAKEEIKELKTAYNQLTNMEDETRKELKIEEELEKDFEMLIKYLEDIRKHEHKIAQLVQSNGGIKPGEWDEIAAHEETIEEELDNCLGLLKDVHRHIENLEQEFVQNEQVSQQIEEMFDKLDTQLSALSDMNTNVKQAISKMSNYRDMQSTRQNQS